VRADGGEEARCDDIPTSALVKERRENGSKLRAHVGRAVLSAADALASLDTNRALCEVEIGEMKPEKLTLSEAGVDEGSEDGESAGALVGRGPRIVLGGEENATKFVGRSRLGIHARHRRGLHAAERVEEGVSAFEVVEEGAKAAPKRVHRNAGEFRAAAVPRDPLLDREEAVAEGVARAGSRGKERLEVRVCPLVASEAVGALTVDVERSVEKGREATIEGGDGPLGRIGRESGEDGGLSRDGGETHDRPRVRCVSSLCRNRGRSPLCAGKHGGRG